MPADDMYADLRRQFDKYWISTLQPFLQQKEELRLKYVARFWILVVLSVVVLPMTGIGIYLINEHFGTNIDTGFFYMICVLCVFVCQTPYRLYKKKIKNDVMQTFISFFDGFSYAEGNGLSVDEMKKSHIFPNADVYEADDCFEGIWQGMPLRVTEQILKTIYYSKNKRRERVVFQGIAVELNMNKEFDGQTVVLKDAGFLNRFKGFKGLERITLEDPKFEKIFEVYSTNQVEARFLLTPVFMEKIVCLKDLYQGKSIQLSFLNQKVLIAIDTKHNMFEPCSFFKTNLNKKKVDAVFGEFLTIFSIIDLLKIAKRRE